MCQRINKHSAAKQNMQVLLLMLLRVTRRPVLTIVFVLATAVRGEGHNTSTMYNDQKGDTVSAVQLCVLGTTFLLEEVPAMHADGPEGTLDGSVGLVPAELMPGKQKGSADLWAC
jgi:hypothetical protein